MPPRRLVVLSLAVLPWSGAARSLPASTPPEILSAIRQLDDDTYLRREQATQFLWEAGTAAEPALKEAAVRGDPEVRARAQRVLEKFRYGIYPSTPKEIAKLVDEYHFADSNGRLSIIGKLAETGGYGIVVLGRLESEETDPIVKENIRVMLVARASKAMETAAILLAENQDETAARMLEEAATVSGDEIAARAYAAFLLSTGKLKEKLTALQPSARIHLDLKLAREIAFMHRAAGNLDAAQDWAVKGDDARLVESLQLERRDWAGFAKSYAASNEGLDDIRRTGLLAAVQGFAKDQAGFNASIARLRILRKRTDTQGQAVMALLLNEQIDDALSIHLDRKAYLNAFDLYRYTGRFTEAIALVDQAVAENHPDAAKLRAVAAKLLSRLGEQDKAQAMLDAALTENERRKEFGVYVYLCEAEKELGRLDRARAHAAWALAVAKEGDSLTWLFSRLFPQKEAAAELWWRFLARQMSGRPTTEILLRLTAVMENTLSAGELETLVDQAARGTASEAWAQREQWLQLLGNTLKDAGRHEAAAVYLDQLTAAHGQRGEWAEVANLLIEKQDWPAAADACRRAAFHPADFPALVWLRGYALLQSGKVNDGKTLMQQAKKIVLSDERHRHNLGETMAAHGFTDDAREQRELILRTGQSRGWTFYDTAKQLGNDAAARGDYLKASGYWELFLLQVLDDGGQFINETTYLELPQLVHHGRARGLLARGDAAGALAELRSYLAITPVAAQLGIDFVPEFDKAGHRAEGDQLFALIVQNLKKLHEAFPRSAYYHNDLAWACAVCNREPELALAQARRAVELAPNDTNCLDTLAEIYFRAGRLSDAEAVMKKCIELEPKQDRHRQRLEGFQAGKGFSQ